MYLLCVGLALLLAGMAQAEVYARPEDVPGALLLQPDGKPQRGGGVTPRMPVDVSALRGACRIARAPHAGAVLNPDVNYWSIHTKEEDGSLRLWYIFMVQPRWACRWPGGCWLLGGPLLRLQPPCRRQPGRREQRRTRPALHSMLTSAPGPCIIAAPAGQ
jgi:hypothetical protein